MPLELLKSKTGRMLIKDLTGFIVVFALQTSTSGAGLDSSWFCGNLSGLSETKVTVTFKVTVTS